VLPFNRPYATGAELRYIAQAIDNLHLSGNGPFTERCCRWLEQAAGARHALLTHSGTGALEMAAMLLDLEPGDEVIMPSYTFVSTANAFVLRGAVPVFVDVRPDTLNLDERLLEDAIGPRTRAIVPVHYAGVAAEMDAVCAIARAHGLAVVADAAQAVLSTYHGRPVLGLGDLAAVSFHETKNVSSGEGGALLVNDARHGRRADVIQEKGTNRREFFRGEVDKYTWVDIGSSYLPSEINAAFLYAQLEEAERITAERLGIWSRYHEAFAELEARGRLRRPVVPRGCGHNGHLYHLLLEDGDDRDRFLRDLRARGVHAVFHYVPLHSSPAGARFARPAGDLPVTTSAAARVARLPLWAGMTGDDVELVIDAVWQAVAQPVRRAASGERFAARRWMASDTTR